MSRRERQPGPSVEYEHGSYDGIGAVLRDARTALGYDCAQVAEALCMRTSQVEALEQGRFGDLPGATYAAGFLRSYARLLGLSPEQVVEAFRDEAQALRTPTKLEFPLPPDEGKRPGLALVVVSLVAAGAIYGIWHSNSSDSRLELNTVSEVPERLVAAVSEWIAPSSGVPRALDVAADDASGTAAEPAAEDVVEPAAEVVVTSREEPASASASEPARAPDSEVVAVPEPAAGETAATPPSETAPSAPGTAMAATVSEDDDADTPPPAPEGISLAATEDAAAAPPPLPGDARESAADAGYVPRTLGAVNKNARVVLKARADSWVQIQGANSELVLTRVLRAGDTYQVPNRDDLVMMTGNAGGIIFVVDGKSFPPMGPDGAVRRNIPLSPKELVARVTATQ